MSARSFLAFALLLVSTLTRAACYTNCSCSDNTRVWARESYGPFNSTAACMAAAGNFSMRCKSGNQAHWFTASCSPCMNCDPPPAARLKAPQSGNADTNNNQQSAFEEARKAQEAAAQRQFESDMGSLKQGLKGVEINGQNEIRLKAPPSGSALRQLDCARQQSMTGSAEQHGKDWTYSSDCKPVRPDVPTPTPVAADGATTPSSMQLKLQQRIVAKRQELMRQESEIARLEKTVEAEEFKAPEIRKGAPSGESDSLRRAREALAKAKADRARTAAELSKLEKQETADSGDKR